MWWKKKVDVCEDCGVRPCTCGNGNYSDPQMRVAHRIGLWAKAVREQKDEKRRIREERKAKLEHLNKL